MVVSGPAPLASRGSWLAIKGQGAEVLAARCDVESKQASRQAGKQAGVQVGAGAPPKVPDVTLQPEQGGAHHRDSRPSPRPRWKSLEVAATGPFEGGEVWLGQWATSGGEAPRSLAGPSALRRRLGPSSHASSRLPHASSPPKYLLAGCCKVQSNRMCPKSPSEAPQMVPCVFRLFRRFTLLTLPPTPLACSFLRAWTPRPAGQERGVLARCPDA
jgi:hypothetical protein